MDYYSEYCSAGKHSSTLSHSKLSVEFDVGEEITAPAADCLKHIFLNQLLVVYSLSSMSRSISTGYFSSYCISLIKKKYFKNTY